MVEKKIRYKRFKFKVKGLISIPTRPTLSYTFGKWNIHFSIDKKKAEMFSNFKTINFSQERFNRNFSISATLFVLKL